MRARLHELWRRRRGGVGRPEREAPKKRLLVVCPYPENVAPGQRLKYEQYFDHFRESGIEVVVSPFVSARLWTVLYKRGYYVQKIFWTLVGYVRRVRDLARLPFYDGTYVFLWVTPFGPPLFEFLYAKLARNLVYDIDDMVFLGHSSRANRFIGPLKGKAKMLYMMREADHVIVCTPRLAEVAQARNPRVTDISSTVNTTVYRPTNRYVNESTLTLGWSGSHSTTKYLKLLDRVLAELRAELDFNILVIGDAHFRFDSVPCESIAWRAETEVADLQRIDVGLYPLPDEEWVYGKSGLKAIQYMALGIPTVATAIGANFRVIEDGVSGFLVRTEEEWKARLRELISNPELRRTIGLNARRRVEELFSVEANKHTYLEILTSVMR